MNHASNYRTSVRIEDVLSPTKLFLAQFYRRQQDRPLTICISTYLAEGIARPPKASTLENKLKVRDDTTT
jgi:hypothetical protein